MTHYEADVVIAGAGLAGISCAIELLDLGKRVVLLDKDTAGAFGGMAKESFGGVHMIDTVEQRRLGIKDSPELALRDWHACAQFGPEDAWPRAWAKLYCDESIPLIWEFLTKKKVSFLPLVNWPERGMHATYNSLPRWHIAWGTGAEIIAKVVGALEAHPRRSALQVCFEHSVNDVTVQAGRVTGVEGVAPGGTFSARAAQVVIAAGGMCGGDLSMVRKHWYKPWGAPPPVLLNGGHRYGDGALHEKVQAHGGVVTHLDKQWHYAAGVHHPRKARPHDGLSLVPPRSALWMNALGERIGPEPLVAYTDTRYLVERILAQPGGYSWQVLNRRIALKELAVSGADFMRAFREKKKLLVAKQLLFGNAELVDRLLRECPDDFVTARSLDELADKMDEKNLQGLRVNKEAFKRAVTDYDAQIERGQAFFNDEQLRRLMNYRTYRGDRVRMCKYPKIVEQKSMPLIAIREFIMSRKGLGGMQTDLSGRVLGQNQQPIAGLYAAGEAAGFGGGGIHGMGALEGTFLGACVLTGRVTARAIGKGD